MTDSCFVILVGGMGNQLFQIAAAWAHCKRNGLTLRISKGTHGGRETVWDTFTHKCVKYIGAPTGPLWREPSFAYQPIPSHVRNLYGYFQSSKYWTEFAEEIRDLFDPPASLKKKVAAKYVWLLADAPAYTVVHIRRGDFFAGANAPIHGVLTEDYYRRAVRPTELLVFSDDLAWARGLEFLAGATFVDEPDGPTALHLMSQFENYVISNSTFSWWAVWLGRPAKTVIAPDRWFGPAGPKDYQDIYEPTWIKVPVVP